MRSWRRTRGSGLTTTHGRCVWVRVRVLRREGTVPVCTKTGLLYMHPCFCYSTHHHLNQHVCQGHRGRAYHARVRLPMSTPPGSNTTACLAADTCRPLGGFSVWGALPPIPAGKQRPDLMLIIGA